MMRTKTLLSIMVILVGVQVGKTAEEADLLKAKPVVKETREEDGTSLISVVVEDEEKARYTIDLSRNYEPATAEDDPLVRTLKARRLGAFLCYNSNQYSGTEFCRSKDPVGDFRPASLDVDQWMKTLNATGMDYAVLTVRHTSEFLLWDSATSECDSMAAIGRDIVGEYVPACRRAGIAPGIYYCLWGSKKWRPHSDARATILAQLHELATKYGKIDYFWLDMAHAGWLTPELSVQEIYDALKSVNPECIVIFNQGIQNGTKLRAFPTDAINGEMKSPPAAGHESWRTVNGKRYYMPFEYEPCSQNRGEGSKQQTAWDYSDACWFTYGDGKGFVASRSFPASYLHQWIKGARDRGASAVLLSCAPDWTGQFRDEDAAELARLGKMIDAADACAP